MAVRLADVLAGAKPQDNESMETTVMDGAIEPDHHDGFFRLYLDPVQRSRYYVIKQDDVVGDLYQWSQEELMHAALVGQQRYRIRVKNGAMLQIVSVRMHRVGEIASLGCPDSTLPKRCTCPHSPGEEVCCAAGSPCGCSANGGPSCD